MTVATVAAPALWRTEKTVFVSGHTVHRQPSSPVSEGFAAPAMPAAISFRPDALAAAMARTLTLRHAPDEMLAQWARSQLIEIKYLVQDGSSFELSPFITALGDADRSGFPGRVGAGVTDLLMNALGYVWRDNGASLTGSANPHADFIYAGGAVASHGVVLAEAHGSFAKAVTSADMRREAKQKYLRQVKPHIGGSCVHGTVVHGYSVAFGSNPIRHDTFLHVAETEISKKKRKPILPKAIVNPAGAGSVPTSLALAANRSNFLLMGASQIVAWIDWLTGAGNRPDDESDTTFLTFELAGRRFVVASESLFPFIRPWLLLDELDFRAFGPRESEYERWRRRLRSGLDNVFAMDELAAKSFLSSLSGMAGGQAAQLPPTLDLPMVEPFGLVPGFDRPRGEEESRYPFVLFRDGLALLGRLPRSSMAERRSWSPMRGFG
ncbi:hypothetical protein V1282_003912 [Nitrobacteraceae bacterium AZCC 2146]